MMLVLFAAFTGCLTTQVDSDSLPLFNSGDEELGYASAKRNGKDGWRASAGLRFADKDSIDFNLFLYTYDDHGSPAENIVLALVPLRLGEYEVKSYLRTIDENHVQGSCFILIEDGHITDAVYKAIDDSNSSITLTKIDWNNSIIEGEFKIHMALKSISSGVYYYKDEMTWSSGRFQVSMKEL